MSGVSIVPYKQGKSFSSSRNSAIPPPPGLSDSPMPMQESVMLIVGNYSVTCRVKLTYHPDPHFTSFTTTRTGKDMSVVIQVGTTHTHFCASLLTAARRSFCLKLPKGMQNLAKPHSKVSTDKSLLEC